jgi:hypothetical protein
MRHLFTLIALVLLAGSLDGGSSTSATPGSPRDVHVDRHVDAHVPAREGDPAASVADDRSERRSAPDPAQGTGILQPPSSPPMFHLYRDRLYRDRPF